MRISDLTEAFTDSYPYQWTMNDGIFISAEFKPNDGTPVNVTFGCEDPDEDEWSVSFRRGYDQGINGEGDQFRIFSTVLRIMGDFINKINPNSLIFCSDEEDGPSRSRLYDRMCSSLSRKFGYNYSDKESDSGGDWFILTKMNQAS